MPSYLIESFKGGISQFEDKGQAGAYKFGSSLDIRKAKDSLSCNQALTDADESDVVSGLILWSVPASDGNLYLFDDQGNIYKLETTGTITLVYTDTNGKIRGAACAGNATDIYLYWATADKLNRKLISDDSAWSNVNADAGWPKNLTSAAWHTLTFINGSLQVCNKHELGYLSVSDDSFNPSALQLFPIDTAKCLIERQSYSIVGTSSDSGADQTGFYYWDQITTNYIQRKTLPANNINAIIDSEIPLAQIGDDGWVYYGDALSPIPIFRFPGGGQVNPHGVCLDGGVALFGVYGADNGYNGIYAYGRKLKDHQITLTLEQEFECSEIGTITRFNGNTYISYQTGAAYFFKKLDLQTKQEASYISLDLKTPKNMPSKLPVWGSIHLLTKPMPSGTSISVKYRLDKTGDFISANITDGSTSFNTEGATEADFYVGDKAKIFEFKIILTPNGNETPEVYSAQVFFE